MTVSSVKHLIRRILNLMVRDFSGRGKYLNHFLLALNRKSVSTFYTFHHRPKRNLDIYLDAAPASPIDLPKTAIVIQGPVVHQDDFTLESVRLYRRTMPQAVVVVSTWTGLTPAQTASFQSEGALVVMSEPPKVSGAHNVNFQIVSTRAGIAAAEELGCSYIMKTRADQRLYAQNILPYLFSLLETYPSPTDGFQRERIIELSNNICRYRPYSMSDMFQFGHIDDMIVMWNIDLDPRSIKVSDYSRQKITPRKIATDRVAEVFIHRAYLDTIGVKTEVDLRSYYEHLAKYFIVIDKDSLDLYWEKYAALEYFIENPMYAESRAKARFYSRDWHTVLKYGPNALDTSDHLLDMPEN